MTRHMGYKSPLYGDVHICKVMQDEVDNCLILVFSEVLDKRLRRQLLSKLISCQTILGECVIEGVDS